jgi:hypothetical protein
MEHRHGFLVKIFVSKFFSNTFENKIVKIRSDEV